MKRLLLSLLVFGTTLVPQVDAFTVHLQKAGTNRTTFDAYAGQPLDVEIFVDTEGEPLAGVSIYLSFDDTYLEVLDADPTRGELQPVETGSFITWQTLENDTHGDPGNSINGFQVDYSKMTLSDEGAVIGTGVVGVLHLMPLKPTVSTQIKFDDSRFSNRETQGSRVDNGVFTTIHFRETTPAVISIKGGPQFDRPLPEIHLLLGESQDIDLDEYVSDTNTLDSALTWSIGDLERLETAFDTSSHVLSIQSDGAWTGQQALALEVSDPEGNRISGDLMVFVGAAPILASFPEITLRLSGAVQNIRLDEFVEDADTPVDQIQWNVSGNEHVSATISPQRVLTLRPMDEWYGTVAFQITADDPERHRAQASFSVRVLPDKTNPIVANLPDVMVSADGRFSIPRVVDLDTYVSDPDDTPDTIQWQASSNEPIQAQIDPKVHTVIFSSDSWTGSGTIRFTATDPQGEEGKGDMKVTVVPSTMPPMLKQLPDVYLIAHAPGKVLDLDEYVFDLNHSVDEIEWRAEGQNKVKLTFGPRHLLTISAEEPAREMITLTATDPDQNQAKADVLVIAEGLQPPVIASLPETVLKSGDTKTVYDLDDYVSDDYTPPAQIQWRASGFDASHLVVSINTEHQVLVVAKQGWHGTEHVLFSATDSDGNQTDRDAVFRMTASPVLELPSRYEMRMETTNTSILLGDYVSDPDTNVELLRWEVTSDSPLVVGIQNHHGLMLYAPPDVLGEFPIQVLVEDPEGNSDAAALLIAVVEEIRSTLPPELSPIPDMQLEQGQDDAIALKPIVKDEDTSYEKLQWLVTSDQPEVSAELSADELRIATDPEYLGDTRIVLTVQDPEGNAAETEFVVTVLEEGSLDPTPVLIPFPPLSLLAGTMDASLDMDDYVRDVDTDRDQLAWEVVDAGSFQAFVESDSHRLILTAPKGDAGNYQIEIQVTDPEKHTARQSLMVTVKAILAPPPVEPKDQRSPTFEMFVLRNPLLEGSIQIVVRADEALKADPIVTVLLDGQEFGLDLQKMDSQEWSATHLLPRGRSGSATIRVMGVDLAGNIGKDSSKVFKFAPTNVPPTSARIVSYPNPATTETTFFCRTDGEVTVEVQIYDLRGSLVATLSDATFTSTQGGYVSKWNLANNAGQPVSPGLYFASMRATYNHARTYHHISKLLILPQ